MTEYGYYKSRKRGRNRNAGRGRGWGNWLAFGLKAVDIVFLVVTIGVTVCMALALLSKYISPASIGYIPLLGLVFPVLYVAELICFLYWAMRWKKHAFVCAAMLLAGFGSARLFYRPDVRERYDQQEPQRTEMIVMSYNVMNYSYPYARGEKKPVELIAQHVRDNNISIWCVQESNSSKEVQDIVAGVLPDMKNHYFKAYSGRDNETVMGLSIYSKYAVVARGVVADPGNERLYSIWADLKVKHDTVRVVNCHLQSTFIKDSDIDYLSSLRIVTEERGRERLRNILGKLNSNYKKRAPQADKIAEFVKSSPHPVILCGDFNDTPVSYAYRKIGRGMDDAFVGRGRGTAGTYNGFFNMFRIDYILMSDELEIINYYPFDVVHSDHNPIAASFDFVRKDI